MPKRVLSAPENAVLGCAAGTIEVTSDNLLDLDLTEGDVLELGFDA